MSVNANWAIEMELAGVNNGWTDVTADVRAEEGLKANWGMSGIGVTDRVAPTGTMTFALNNGPTNSAKKIGYYAPDHVNVRSGFDFGIRARLKLTYAPLPSPVYRFLGSIDTINSTPGVRGGYLSRIIVVDWMDEAARYYVTGIPMQTNVRGDQVFSTVIAPMPIQPAAIQTTPGLDTYPYALDNVQDQSTTVLSIFQNLAMSELGYIYIRSDTMQGGTLVYEPRSTRGGTSSSVQVFSNSMDDVVPSRTRATLLNKIQVTAHPRTVDPAPTTVLFQLNSATLVGPGDTLVLTGPYRDPTNPLARVGGTNMQAPVARTDYVANTAVDGSGTDLTSSFLVTATFSSNTATFSVTNTGGIPGYVGGNPAILGAPLLQCRGQGVYDYDTAVLLAEDVLNQQRLGQRVVNVDMPYQADPAVANEAAQYILNVYSNPLTGITKLSILGNWTDALMRAVLLRDISDRIGLDETITGLSDAIGYFINSVQIEISAGRKFVATFTLAPADQNSYWLLEIPGRSELDETTRLGYGLIVGHTDIAHGDSHTDTAHVDSAHVDVAHIDAAHVDMAHADSAHSDVTHSDVAHADATHGDSAHSDSHDDVAHVDAHSDIAHSDAHTDTTNHFDFSDSTSGHFDRTNHFDTHNDTVHDDSHGDSAHSDDFSDVAHNDVAHGDVNHSDVAHVDAGHADSGHTDTAHVDTAHTDTAHVDTAHGDSHLDSAHGDID